MIKLLYSNFSDSFLAAALVSELVDKVRTWMQGVGGCIINVVERSTDFVDWFLRENLDAFRQTCTVKNSSSVAGDL
jgi:hypothetical protein